MDKLQRVLNAAARVVTGTRKFDRGLSQILHDELHWLNVPDQVFFKLAVLVHRCLNGRAPPYLSDYCLPVAISASAFRQPSATCSTSLPSQHLRPPCPVTSPASQSGTLSQISSGIRPLVQSVSDVCLKRICLLDTNAFSVLEVLHDYCKI